MLLGRNGTHFVDWLANDVQDATENFAAHGHHDLVAGVHCGLTAGQTVSGIHRDATNGVFADVLSNFHHQRPFLIGVRLIRHANGLFDRRDLTWFELDVDDRTDDLFDPTHISGIRCS
jgi:hypothetical protein